MHKFFLFHFFTRIEYQSTTWTSCGSVATWAEFQHRVVDNAVDQWRKSWKRAFMQKVVNLNTCCNVDCPTFHLPHITTGSFQTQQCQPTTGLFQS